MTEPVTIALAKAHLGIEAGFTADDTIIAAYIAASRSFVEEQTGRALVRREFIEIRGAFGDWLELYRQPVDPDGAITITYTDASGADAEYVAAVARTDTNPPRLYPPAGSAFPELGDNGRVSVTYTAGYAAGQVPEPLIQAMLLMIGHFYVNREAAVIGTGSAMELPYAVDMLIAPFKLPVL